MEVKINIAEILKDKPQGIRLYSPIFGECAFCFVREDTEDICVKKHNGEKAYFNSEGLYNALGEVMLFPSKELRDWLKFTWKKGDVLQHSEYPLTVIFESFEDDTYTSFKCKYCFDIESASKWLVSNSQCSIKHFYKVSEEEAKEFIRKFELNYNGKLNRETLEIESAQPEFKDGDVVFVESDMLGINTCSMIAIFRKEKEIDKYKFSPALCESNEHDTYLREDTVVLSPSYIIPLSEYRFYWFNIVSNLKENSYGIYML